MSFVKLSTYLARQNRQLKREKKQVEGQKDHVERERNDARQEIVILRTQLAELRNEDKRFKRLESAQKELDRMYAWLAIAETRAYVVLTVQTVILVFLALVGLALTSRLGQEIKQSRSLNTALTQQVSAWENVALFSIIIGAAAIMFALVAILLAASDRTTRPKNWAAEPYTSGRFNIMKRRRHFIKTQKTVTLYEKVAKNPDTFVAQLGTEAAIISQIQDCALIARDKFKYLSGGGGQFLYKWLLYSYSFTSSFR